MCVTFSSCHEELDYYYYYYYYYYYSLLLLLLRGETAPACWGTNNNLALLRGTKKM